MKHRIFTVFLTLFIIFTMCPAASANASTGKIDIYDNADFFTESEEQELKSYIETMFFDDINMDIVVLTEPFDPTDEVKYTDNFYDSNGYGDDGILFFVSENIYYINTVGYGIIAISDSEVESILDDGYPGFKNYDFYECVHSMITSANSYVKYAYDNGYVDSGIDTDVVPVVPHKQNNQPDSNIKPKPNLFSAFLPNQQNFGTAATLTIIIIALLFFVHKKTSSEQNAKVYLTQNFEITKMNQTYLGTRETVQHNYYKPNTSSSGGHSSGSSHRSSSGRSHGGGGRSR